MKTFKSFNIKTESESFVGDKKKVEWILDKEITVYAFKVVPSKYSGQRLDMQIGLGEEKFVVFTGSKILIELIEKIPKSGFPFSTTICKINRHFEFT